MTATASTGATTRRDRKKQQTRHLISGAAIALFIENGFEQTTIAQVAEAADVAKMTVTNYFPLKEDLVFDRTATLVGVLAGAVASRPLRQTVLDSCRGLCDTGLRRRDPTLGFADVAFARLVDASAALRAREGQMFAAQERALADVLLSEFTPSLRALELRFGAAQLTGVFRLMYDDSRRRLMAGEATDDSVEGLRQAATATFDLMAPALSVSLGGSNTQSIAAE